VKPTASIDEDDPGIAVALALDADAISAARGKT
jgi:hypothetical protein